jgi:hypothetical protein
VLEGRRMIPGEEKEEEVVPYNSGDVEDSMTNNTTVCYSSSWTGLQGAGNTTAACGKSNWHCTSRNGKSIPVPYP